MKKYKLRFYLYLISCILLVVLGIMTYGYINDKSENQKISFISDDFSLNNGDDIILGNKNAHTHIYMFGNYQCHYCVKFFKEELSFILKRYDGKVNVILKLVPFSNTKEEQDALKMAISVFKYGNYMPFHNLLLKDPKVIYSDQYQEYLMEIMNYNEAIAINFSDDKTADYIKENKQLFQDLEFKGTPAFVINKKIISGYIGLEDFNDLIDGELK